MCNLLEQGLLATEPFVVQLYACLCRHSGGVCDLLEQGLTPESAARTTHALGFLARELASGRLDSNAETPSVQSTQPGILFSHAFNFGGYVFAIRCTLKCAVPPQAAESDT